MPTIQRRSKYWCFTINNPNITDICQLDFNQPEWRSQVTFAIYAEEIGEEETIHYQGYMELEQAKTLSWLKRRMSRAHFESRRGTQTQAIIYCLKNYDVSKSYADTTEPVLWNSKDTSMTWRTLKTELEQSGTRSASLKTDTPRTRCLQEMKQMIEDGASDLDLANFNFNIYITCYRGLRHYRSLISPKRNWKTKVIICQGPTGTGKSKWCMETFPDAYWKQRGQWWDNYAGEETVIIDEFYGWLPFDLILRLCDRYPLMVEIKGGQVQFRAKTIVFTSNNTPDRWYKNAYMKSFYRRVEEWHIFPVWGEHEIIEEYESALLRMINNE